MAGAWAKLLKRNMSLMDVLASHTLKVKLRSRDMASLVWSFARFALYHEPLLTKASTVAAECNERDLATIV